VRETILGVVKPIRSEADYEAALAEVELAATGPEYLIHLSRGPNSQFEDAVVLCRLSSKNPDYYDTVASVEVLRIHPRERYRFG